MTQESKLTIDSITSRLRPILEELDCNFAFLFGSQAQNSSGWWSDIDIAVSIPYFTELSPEDQYNLMGKVSLDMDRALQVANIELHIWEIAPIRLKFEILAAKSPIFDKNSEFTMSVKERTLIEYWDHQIWYEHMMKVWTPK